MLHNSFFSVSRYDSATGKLLDSQLVVGANRDEPTTAVLALEPEKRDDGRGFRCTVWNRAMAEGELHEGRAKIRVNCE